jgi:hypothetical protein
MKKLLLFTLVIGGFLSAQNLAAQITIIDDGSGTGTTTWTSDNVYLLDGFVFVNDGQTLTIEPGTVIKGKPGTGANASALIVARGGKIIAEGTAANPIIFTFENDPLDGSVPYSTRGQWGGLIVLGKAQLNSVPGESAIEGIPTSEPRGLYGGTDDNDNSGIIKYVSIRHGGTDIGAGNEINGLTLGGVGRNTEIDYVEVFSNADDGIEFFGGVAEVKHAVVAFNSDDAYDYDEGYRGKGQFWVLVQDSENGVGDRGGEHDGGTDPEDGMPFTKPVIYNVTYVGRGIAADKRAITFRDNAGGFYHNSIFVNWGKGIDVEKLGSGEDSYARFQAGELALQGNLFWDVVTAGGGATGSDLFKISFADGVSDNGEQAAFEASFAANGNAVVDAGLEYDNVTAGSNALQLVPNSAANGGTPPADAWFDGVSYRGAFQPNEDAWIQGWTLLSQYDFLAATPEQGEVTIVDDGSGTGTTTWTSDNVYLLDGFVFVNDGQTLTIEPGTVIKGKPGTGANASALIVARGGKILAEGTPEAPIVFTFENDPLDGSVPYSTRGQWGGLIVLGKAQLNSVPGESAIEGIPTSEPRGLYGGTDDNDNSGIIKYVSIRHGGTDIGAGNEINGLTLGGVGRNTVIDYVEVFSNADDGIEFFGGTAEVKHALVAFNSDDAYDYDEGYRGKGQYWVLIQDSENEVGDRGGEHDGGTDPEDGTPFTKPVIYNVTYVGRGIAAGKRALTFRDNAGGFYHNSIFVNWGKGVDIEKLDSGEDSYARFDAGDLALQGNLFWDVVSAGGGATASDLFQISFADGVSDNGEQAAFEASFAANGNVVGNPGLEYDVVTAGAQSLQLVPNQGPVWGATPASDDWFDAVDYRGAFKPNMDAWIKGWTLLDEYEFLADYILSVEDQQPSQELVTGYYPNPVEDLLTIDFDSEVKDLQVTIYDVTGKLISVNAYHQVGTQLILDVQDLNSGMYLIALQSELATRSFKVFVR